MGFRVQGVGRKNLGSGLGISVQSKGCRVKG